MEAPQLGDIQAFVIFLYITYLTLFSSVVPLTTPLDRFARTMTQTTRFSPRNTFLGSRYYQISFRGLKSLKTPIQPSNVYFPAESKQSNKFLMVRDRRKFSTYHLNKNRVGQ
jgi:hypothetical protein